MIRSKLMKGCSFVSLLLLITLYCNSKEQISSGVLSHQIKEVRNVIEKLLKEIIEIKLEISDDELKTFLDEKYDILLTIEKSLPILIKPQDGNVAITRSKSPPNQNNVTTIRTQAGNHVNNKNNLSYSCPEYYAGSLFGHPLYETGFVRTNCNKVPLNQSVSLILIDPSIQTNIVDNTNNLFTHRYVLFKENTSDVDGLFTEGIIVRKYGATKFSLGHYLNEIMKNMTTRFVLIVPQLAQWHKKTSIERLIHVHEMSGSVLVSASTKDIITKEWNRGCYQSTLQMYVLRYSPLYRKSKHGCLYCDYTNNPFLSTVRSLREIGFNRNLNQGVLMDFQIRMKQQNRSLLLCPDVIFLTKARKLNSSQLNLFAKTFDIKKIELDKNELWFGCRRNHAHTSKIKCFHGKGMAVPPCCIENLKDAISFLFYICESENIKCKLQEGSVLGALKFNSILPWERDADISIPVDQFLKFQNLFGKFKLREYELVVDEVPSCCDKKGKLRGGVMHIRANGWSIQVFAQTNFEHSSSHIKINNQKISLPSNPGLYVLNRYGNEVYKHAEHWSMTGMKTGWELYDSGRFENCSIPGHHACLNQFEADGDFLFK